MQTDCQMLHIIFAKWTPIKRCNLCWSKKGCVEMLRYSDCVNNKRQTYLSVCSPVESSGLVLTFTGSVALTISAAFSRALERISAYLSEVLQAAIFLQLSLILH